MITITIPSGDFRESSWLNVSLSRHSERNILKFLYMCARGKDHTWVAWKTIINKTGYCETTVRNVLNFLEEKGFIYRAWKNVYGKMKRAYFFLDNDLIPKKNKILKKMDASEMLGNDACPPQKVRCITAKNAVDFPTPYIKENQLIESPPPSSSPESIRNGANREEMEIVKSQLDNPVLPPEWTAACEKLQAADPKAYQLYVEPLKYAEKTGPDEITVGADGDFDTTIAKKQYGAKIREILLYFGLKVRFSAGRENKKVPGFKEDKDCRIQAMTTDEEFDVLQKTHLKKCGEYRIKTVFEKYNMLRKQGKLPSLQDLLEKNQNDRSIEGWDSRDVRYVPSLDTWLNGIAGK
jgi:hypothetical protein